MKYKAKIIRKYFVGDEIFGGVHTDYEIIRDDGYTMSFTEGDDITEEEALQLFKINSLRKTLEWGGWQKFWRMMNIPEKDWFMPICEDDFFGDNSPENPKKHDLRKLGFHEGEEPEIRGVLTTLCKKHLEPEVWENYYIELDKILFSVPKEEEYRILDVIEPEIEDENNLLDHQDLLTFLKIKEVIE